MSNKVKTERLKLNLTQYGLAKAINKGGKKISINTITNIEEETVEPKMKTCKILADFFGVSFDYLFN